MNENEGAVAIHLQPAVKEVCIWRPVSVCTSFQTWHFWTCLPLTNSFSLDCVSLVQSVSHDPIAGAQLSKRPEQTAFLTQRGILAHEGERGSWDTHMDNNNIKSFRVSEACPSSLLYCWLTFLTTWVCERERSCVRDFYRCVCLNLCWQGQRHLCTQNHVNKIHRVPYDLLN